MAGVAHRTAAALLGVMLVAGQAACGSSDGGAGATSVADASNAASPTAGPSATASAPTYRLGKPLCDAADITPLTDAYRPGSGKPLRNSARSCIESMVAKSPRMVMSLSVQADPLPDELGARLSYESERRTWRYGTPTDVTDVGTQAYWVTNGNAVEIIGYHGNLILTMTFSAVNGGDRLPPGIPERMMKAMNGTFRNLAG